MVWLNSCIYNSKSGVNMFRACIKYPHGTKWTILWIDMLHTIAMRGCNDGAAPYDEES